MPQHATMEANRRRNTARLAWWALDTRDALRAEWNNNFAAYMEEAGLDLDREDQTTDAMQQGMMLFRRLVGISTPRQVIPHWESGKSALTAMVDNLAAGTPLMRPNGDFVLVSLDFEGHPNHSRGVTEVGWATLDTRDLYALREKTIGRGVVKAHNVRPSTKRKDKFIFGTTRWITRPELVQTIKDVFAIEDELNPGRTRDIILLGHGIRSEITTFGKLGIRLSDLPSLKGIVDTETEAFEILGQKSGRLQHMLQALDVPFCPGARHCGGNDAYYTLKALLAITAKRLPEQSPSTAEWLQRFATTHEEEVWASAQLPPHMSFPDAQRLVGSDYTKARWKVDISTVSQLQRAVDMRILNT